MTDRALATVAEIEEIRPIPDADAIEAVRVRNWWLVAKKDEFQPGDSCVYFEIDSMLDVQDARFAFLAPRGVRKDAEGREGHRLRTVKLRGQLSQGLALPVSEFPELDGKAPGSDVTELLGVWKWEAPVPASISGEVNGGLPWFVPKTDEERIQNCADILQRQNLLWVATEKVDGTSTSIWVDQTQEHMFGVCGRNYDLRRTEGNTLWRKAIELDLHAKLTTFGMSVVLQGETFGEGIQANPLKVKGQHFRAFNLIVNGRAVHRDEWPDWLLEIAVPEFDIEFPKTVEEALSQADDVDSRITPGRRPEGIVWTAVENGERISFKAISNKYLLKNDG